MAWKISGAHLFAAFFTCLIILLGETEGQVTYHELTGFSLSPPYFNLAQGSSVSATATCGQDEAGRSRSDLYCKLVGGPTTALLTQNIQGQFCDYCNSEEPNKAHPVTNAIDGTERWWQSPPLSRGAGYNVVNVTLDLGQLFHVAYVIIKFANSPRPDLWVLERSVDYGRTFTPWQYFAHSKYECIERFGKQPNARIVRDDDQLCTTEYSGIVPLENGEIVVSVVNGRPGSRNFTYSPVLRDFTKATNIRLHFLRTNTLLGHLISKAQRDPTVTRRYYYSIKDISIGGRCVCHGHAHECGGGPDRENPNRLQCECQHNTCGESCDRCCPGFNQKPWRAATVDSPNECQSCQCFSHAFDCYYDPEVEKRGASLDTFGRYNGGGVCINCQHNTAGVNCEKCLEGFFRPFGVPPESPTGCMPCRCNSRTTTGCHMGSGRCICKEQFAGENCDRCANGYYYYPECIRYPVYEGTTKSPAGPIVEPCRPGYFGSPSCHQCVCDYRGTEHRVCDASGRCLCRQFVEGQYCNRCQQGYHSFPKCEACLCGGAGIADSICGPEGQCVCLPNYGGQECDTCAPGYYGYPDCAACECSSIGSYGNVCDPVSGQCLCLPGVVGQKCDHCASGQRFPHCSASISQCHPAGTEITDPQTGLCRCRSSTEGVLCDRCKPLHWNLAAGNPQGCMKCSCDLKGTLSGVGQCEQKSGRCHCKSNGKGQQCDSCKDGYFLFQKKNYFACQGCQCDVGGAIGMDCDKASGQCQCRRNIIGLKCTEPAPGYYFPNLYQLKFEVEDGTTPNSRPVRFGYSPHEFPGFSWRGYAILSPAQPEVILTLTVSFPGPFHIVLRYAAPQHKGKAKVRAKILVVDEAGFQYCCDSCAITVSYLLLLSLQNEVRVRVHVDPKDGRQQLFFVVLHFTNPGQNHVTGSVKVTSNRGIAGSEQSKEVIFPVSTSPSFLTVPGEGFTAPFALTPGKWIVHIRAENVLLDYLVLLPRDYYEASLLKEKVTQPCTYLPTGSRHKNCLLYKHAAMDRFIYSLVAQGVLSTRRGRRRRQARVRRPTPDHPEMAVLSGRQSQLQLSLHVPHPGPYALVMEYASEVDNIQNINILVSGQSGSQILSRVNIYYCAYSFLCRSVAVDSGNQVAVLQLAQKTELLLQTSTSSLLLYKVYAVPAKEFSMEYVEPKVLCISTHGRYTEDSQHCILGQFNKPSEGWILYAATDGQLFTAPAVDAQYGENGYWRQRRQSSGFPVFEQQRDGKLLKFPQTKISFTPRVPLPGRYVVVVHYHQPEHISFPIDVQVDAGQHWKGTLNASYCPSVSGCREVVVANGHIALDFNQQYWQQPSISLTVPPRKTLILDYILLLPDSVYTSEVLKQNPLEKSAVFMQQCRGEEVYDDPIASSQFCRSSAKSLAAAYNDGALPCDCDSIGSTGATCDPVGGQCPCREHVIGRQCTKCATRYFGFPYCRPCECGLRLCDDVTGHCICPPQTIRPTCEVCQSETFSYHPLLGCEGCECSPHGIQVNAGAGCDSISGQCSCKPRIGGRKCDRCAPGYYRFPDCVPCKCNQGGVTPNVCDPDTGRCLCKKNVAGIMCGTCQEGSFYFDPSNPNGCTSCFCFGATDRCQSSTKRRGKFVDMYGWRLESPHQQEVPSVLNPVSNTVVADIQELQPTIQGLHWVAPASYLGDRVASYGGFLTYQTKSFGIPSEGMILIDKSPDVLLTGRDRTLMHVAPQIQIPDRLYQGRVQLVEGNWRHAGTNRPVSREELMMVLANLLGLRIRALYFTKSQRLSLGQVGLEEASNTGTGSPGSNLEVCSCPSEYTGDSCEKCTPGYFRDGSGPYLGRCIPCNCNGLAKECEDWTGRCLNCQYNTAGARCEYCKEGYYGNAAQRTCRVCPCPFNTPTNSFAVGCREIDGEFQCICKEGYTGDKCESCAPGFYGNPLTLGGGCKPCNCNGNGNTCDPRTGVCKNTIEPGDTNVAMQCLECDNCAQTLLNDLEKLDDQLRRIKAQLDNANSSASSQDRMKKLERAVSDTKILVNKLDSSLTNQKTRINQLEDDMDSLTDDISSLKDKADKSVYDAEKAVTDVEKSNKRANILNKEIQHMLKKIQDLLDQLNQAGSRGDALPSENIGKMLEDAKRLVKEMENRNFNPQKTAAEKERDQAMKLLAHIKTNVTKQSDRNEATAEKIRGLLKDYEDKLKDLDKALKEAADFVKKANAQNGLSTLALGDLQNRIDDLKKERKLVEDQITMAKDELKKTKDLSETLSDNKMEFERLAGQLDGAKTELTKKVNGMSEAASKEKTVRAAEDHAKKLTEMAKELEEAVKSASENNEVRDARDAIDAYKNITDAVKAAEEAAREAKSSSDKALNSVKMQKFPQRAKDLKDKGQELLDDANTAKRNLEDNSQDINDIKSRLKNAENKKEDLEKDVLDVQNQLKNIQSDDIRDMIDDAKTKAASANDTASNAMEKLADINKKIGTIRATPGDSNLGNVLDDASNTVNDLLKNIPSITDKISELENLTSNFLPLRNITENIKVIKDLIEQARDAANRIMIPMQFSGKSMVEMRPPRNLEDLKAYTNLALSLQRPDGRGDGGRRRRQSADSGNMFVMYLGNRDSSKNYIGMALKGNVLYGVYKLNGVERVIKTGYISTSSSEPAKFDRVELSRIYQDVQMTLTKNIASSKPDESLKFYPQGEESKYLLDLNQDDIVFYIGGYPTSFTPPTSLNFQNYTGCLEMSSFNDRVISLYNFQKAVNVNPTAPCKRYVPPLDSLYFEGTGYGRAIIDKKEKVLRIIMSINARSENGLLLFLASGDNYFTVTMEQGFIHMNSNAMKQPVKTTEAIFPSSDWVEALFVFTHKGTVTVRFPGNTINADVDFNKDDFEDFYVGGAPQELRERHNIKMQPFKGCVKNLKLNIGYKIFDEQMGISKGCPEASLASRKAEFDTGSYLSADLTGFSLANDVSVSLGFKSTETQGLMMKHKEQAKGIDIKLENGHVVLIFNGKMWKSNKQYNDGQWHYLTATSKNGRSHLIVDDEDEGREHSGSSAVTGDGNEVLLGGDQFKGCISNFYTKRPSNLYKAEDLSHFKSHGNVLVDACTHDNPFMQIDDSTPKKDTMTLVMNDNASACTLPALVEHAFHLGGAVSRLSYSLPLQVLQPRPHFALDVKTRSSEGLLFFATTRGGHSHLALYLSKGRIRLSVGKQNEIFNREKYNDGKWHTVMFSLEKKKFRLVVDGIQAQDGQLTNMELSSMKHFISPVYLGSAPESHYKELKSKILPKQSVSGCIRNFKMNGTPMSYPTTNLGVGPCFTGQTQKGAYFSGQGAHVIINDSFVVGFTFELLLNIRPRTPTGLLLHVGSSGKVSHGPETGHYLSIYMLRGEVVALVNNGKGEFKVSVRPKTSLCDGLFHKISVIKRKNVVQLYVDTMDNYKIGPPASITTMTNDPLYVGGIPAPVLGQQAPPVTSSFVGCIQEMKINGEPVSFQRLSVFGPVNLKECPG